MPKYVVLYKFTDQGIKNVKDTVQRARSAIAALEQHGVTTNGLYWTQGEYDLVSFGEAPDEETMLASLLSIAGAGNVRSTTLRAFDASEMEAIIQKMS
jgi:uncharacterized protein with GYD domain